MKKLSTSEQMAQQKIYGNPLLSKENLTFQHTIHLDSVNELCTNRLFLYI